jgi:hypothetical protein
VSFTEGIAWHAGCFELHARIRHGGSILARRVESGWKSGVQQEFPCFRPESTLRGELTHRAVFHPFSGFHLSCQTTLCEGLHPSCKTTPFLPDSSAPERLRPSCRSSSFLPDSTLPAGIQPLWRKLHSMSDTLSARLRPSCRTLPLMPESSIRAGIHHLCRTAPFQQDSTRRGGLLPSCRIQPFPPDCNLCDGAALHGGFHPLCRLRPS